MNRVTVFTTVSPVPSRGPAGRLKDVPWMNENKGPALLEAVSEQKAGRHIRIKVELVSSPTKKIKASRRKGAWHGGGGSGWLRWVVRESHLAEN